MESSIIKTDVQGAPFKIGEKVIVIDGDHTVEESEIGKQGTIEHYEYECGCGQTFPDNPMIGVRLEDGGFNEYWKEELELAA